MTTTLRPFKLFVVCSNYLLRHTLHGCGSLRPFKLVVVRSNYLQKEHCDSREASTHSNDLRHAQIICCRSHCTAAESLFVQIICKALTLFEAAPPCVSNRALRVLRSVLRYAFIVLRVPPPPCVGTCVGMRSLVLRSPAPGRVLGGGGATRNAVFLSTPHDTQNAERTRSGQRPAHLQIQKRRNAETRSQVELVRTLSRRVGSYSMSGRKCYRHRRTTARCWMEQLGAARAQLGAQAESRPRGGEDKRAVQQLRDPGCCEGHDARRGGGALWGEEGLRWWEEVCR